MRNQNIYLCIYRFRCDDLPRVLVHERRLERRRPHVDAKNEASHVLYSVFCVATYRLNAVYVSGVKRCFAEPGMT